jgi:hypothetical protein
MTVTDSTTVPANRRRRNAVSAAEDIALARGVEISRNDIRAIVSAYLAAESDALEAEVRKP